jgi:predicted amino acid racemase
MYPLLTIDLEKIFHNVKEINNRCKSLGIDVTAITKCTGGNVEVAKVFKEAGCNRIGDSRIKNLASICSVEAEKWLIRGPSMSECEDIIQYVDLSLNSDINVIRKLNYESKLCNKKHKIIMMIDLGDLREGYFYYDNLMKDINEVFKFDNIEISGIGSNANCFGATIPTVDTCNQLNVYKHKIEDYFGFDLEIVSAGNSGAYYMIEDKSIPEGITNLRLGEVILFGKETSYFRQYDYLYDNAFKIKVELIEVKEKPSYPIGKIGRDVFGNIPEFIDKGKRIRGIAALGKQDTDPNYLVPDDKNIQIIGYSSDHLILDLTDSVISYKSGDIISFKANYVSTLHAITSKYIDKSIINLIS